ncbi:phospholipid/cholesterol/gamma-HCH transport system substrate-binding protein [Actinopolyspora lacussalsi]|nr:phospholipid/cholesterol/gamma-HCH transport system substrate-binding protein [Actinopolyspora lacussalsi]
MKSFRKRDPIKIGIAGLLVLALGFLLAMNYKSLPFVSGTTYTANFSEAGGLTEGDTVRVAGVKVGSVTGVELDNAHVKVTFDVRDAWVGDGTVAAIKVGTLLGKKYLALDTKGENRQSTSEPIPLRRTMSPYDVIETFSQLSETVDKVDTTQLAKSFRTLSNTLSGTSEEMRGTLQGLSRLSNTISERDRQLKELLDKTNKVATTVAERNTEIEKLLRDGNRLLAELRQRRDAIKSLLDGVTKLSRQITGLVEENSAQLGPALRQLDEVTELLQRNQENLGKSIERMAPFTRLFSNVLGNGRWFDVYLCGLLPPAVGPINQEGCLP